MRPCSQHINMYGTHSHGVNGPGSEEKAGYAIVLD